MDIPFGLSEAQTRRIEPFSRCRRAFHGWATAGLSQASSTS
jgi:hypothetical protein